jgi:hypothetical protein
LFAPVDIASLVYFRIAFGAIMLWEAVRYFQHGWIPRYWIEPASSASCSSLFPRTGRSR